MTHFEPHQTVPAPARAPVDVAYGRVPGLRTKGEPEHHHLDLGFAFTTLNADVGQIQESEVTGAGWYPLAEAASLVGHRIQPAAIVQGLAAGGEAS